MRCLSDAHRVFVLALYDCMGFGVWVFPLLALGFWFMVEVL